MESSYEDYKMNFQEWFWKYFLACIPKVRPKVYVNEGVGKRAHGL